MSIESRSSASVSSFLHQSHLSRFQLSKAWMRTCLQSLRVERAAEHLGEVHVHAALVAAADGIELQPVMLLQANDPISVIIAHSCEKYWPLPTQAGA